MGSSFQGKSGEFHLFWVFPDIYDLFGNRYNNATSSNQIGSVWGIYILNPKKNKYVISYRKKGMLRFWRLRIEE